MAIRNIVLEGDEILRKRAREVTEINDRIIMLLDDMADTMRKQDGVGLAAPQVGMLKRIVVVDIGDGLLELINPEIIETNGEQSEEEACLSVPGKIGMVKRPNFVKLRATDRTGNTVEYESSELLSRVFCHEMDHLNGVLFIDTAKDLRTVENEED
jgi:peptide deformylase